MKIGFPETEVCQRCDGRGHYFVKLGEPGQDPRTVGGYVNIKWTPATGPYWCGPCKATGQREARSPKQTKPKHMRIHENGTMTHERENGYGL